MVLAWQKPGLFFCLFRLARLKNWLQISILSALKSGPNGFIPAGFRFSPLQTTTTGGNLNGPSFRYAFAHQVLVHCLVSYQLLNCSNFRNRFIAISASMKTGYICLLSFRIASASARKCSATHHSGAANIPKK